MLNLKVLFFLVSSMYVTAPRRGQRMILVWSLKKLICMVPLVRCITTALLVLNQVLRAGIRDSWSSSRTWK